MAIPDTSVSLLMQLENPANGIAWEQFIELYGPLIYGFGLKRGITAAEIDDFSQEVFSQVSRSIHRFEVDPEKGKFRSWLFQIARSVLLNRQRHIRRRPGLDGGSTILRRADQELAGESERQLEEVWDLEYRRQLFARAAELVRPEVGEEIWEAFWRTSVIGESGEVVSKDLGVSLGALYVRKSRVIAKLRAAAEKIEAGWEVSAPC